MREYKNYKLYFEDKEKDRLLEDIIDKNFSVEQEYKNDNRTYVAKIKIKDKNYILKNFFIRKKLKKILSIFKEEESVKTFKNIQSFSKEIPELAKIYGAGIKRNGLFIEKEFIVMEYVEGKILTDDENCMKILKVVEKIHECGRFHGDCNPYNFICDSNGNIHVLDTKLKKMEFGNYRAHYDILTLFKHFKNKPEYPYRKNIFYNIAYLVRQYRNRKK
jgi:heptose II phosphotransferase